MDVKFITNCGRHNLVVLEIDGKVHFGGFVGTYLQVNELLETAYRDQELFDYQSDIKRLRAGGEPWVIFDWTNGSRMLARYCSEKIIKDLYNWEMESMAILKYCQHLFDTTLFNWEVCSGQVAQNYPEFIDPDRFNWKKFSWTTAKFCPDKIDAKRYDWDRQTWAIVDNCPMKLHLRP